jgi:hypothetical protein
MRTSADTLGSDKYIAAPDGDLKTYPAEIQTAGQIHRLLNVTQGVA